LRSPAIQLGTRAKWGGRSGANDGKEQHNVVYVALTFVCEKRDEPVLISRLARA